MITPREMIEASRLKKSLNRYSTWWHRIRELLPPLIIATVNGSRKRAALERVMYSPILHHVPQFYVYSTADNVINFDYINKIIDYQRHNADVTRHTFNDTFHMLHRLKHPKEYDNLLFNFLKNKCNLPI